MAPRVERERGHTVVRDGWEARGERLVVQLVVRQVVGQDPTGVLLGDVEDLVLVGIGPDGEALCGVEGRLELAHLSRLQLHAAAVAGRGSQRIVHGLQVPFRILGPCFLLLHVNQQVSVELLSWQGPDDGALRP